MSYQNLPDPRPPSVRLVLWGMPRYIAVSLVVSLVILALAGLAAILVDSEHYPLWIGLALLFGLLAAQYVAAIRWVDLNKTWPRRRTHRRRNETR